MRNNPVRTARRLVVPASSTETRVRSALAREANAIVLVGVAVFLGLALVTFDVNDPMLFERTLPVPHSAGNVTGRAGATLAFALRWALGDVGYLVPAAFLGAGLLLMIRGYVRAPTRRLLALPPLIAGLAGIFDRVTFGHVGILGGGGRLGRAVGGSLQSLFNPVGTYLLLGTVSLVSFVILTRLSVRKLSIQTARAGGWLGLALGRRVASARQRAREERAVGLDDSARTPPLIERGSPEDGPAAMRDALSTAEYALGGPSLDLLGATDLDMDRDTGGAAGGNGAATRKKRAVKKATAIIETPPETSFEDEPLDIPEPEATPLPERVAAAAPPPVPVAAVASTAPPAAPATRATVPAPSAAQPASPPPAFKATAPAAADEPAAPLAAVSTPPPVIRAEQPPSEIIAPPTEAFDAAAPPAKPVQQRFPFIGSDKPWKTPELKLLEMPEKKNTEIDREFLVANADLLEKRLAEYGVTGKVKAVLPGPVITRYELEPAPGVKVSRILALSDDLSLAMKATSIRILAPVPGKAVVGIEIPNASPETVYLREIIAADPFQLHKGKLPMALGKDISGNTIVADLARMPHLLIAGATGSGKSVSLNSMICSLLYRVTPDDVKMIMIDPKMLELSPYEGIPHLMLPVVTDMRKASLALRWAVEEMEKRYKNLARAEVRNIDSYNQVIAEELKRIDETPGLREKLIEEGEEIPEKLRYIVIVIDELADMMMVASKEVEDSICRLAQMARAAGIHLVVATQRPSVDVLTGIIKANFPARISFKVSSRPDSRTILDSIGAERLLGNGDMLMLAPGTSKVTRIHGCYVSDGEIQRVIAHWKKQGKPKYDKSILEVPVEDEDGADGQNDYDEKYDDALAFVSQLGHASISLVQRRFRIGYNRAARIIEKMEREGVLGPSDGAKPRQVLVNRI